MKRLALFTLIITITFSCSGQKLVQTPKDVVKIYEHRERFIRKPLQEVLDQINIPIRYVQPRPIGNPQPFFRFQFIPYNEKLNNPEKIPYTLVVYGKENFEWDFQERLSKGIITEWRKEDAGKNGSLTVVAFRAYGEY